MAGIYGPNQFNNMNPGKIPGKNIGKVQDKQVKVGSTGDKTAKKDFSEILKKEKEKSLDFTKHASQRMNSRNIELTPEKLKQLEDAVDKAASKGAKESLIMMDKTAFVVSVDNKKVITAVDEAGMKDNVFTNIDSAVII
ncbi:TIGR02530 family flagellar biosynthesis protein [Natranaerofaba carboxydovora]|uniref:TIGR02530 family flagellar biosynthesis protein n=1 Tax=Natranaerofaba carboxydovora TaxID=2742683 RepID=UPI001F140F6B|nr:TIGR02530 family flagellar biosynthesis protein [Natranaerofaba carboxydovora]UMZ73364.1 Putative flagellar [Natranaerofaba carboxydovora]